MSGRTLLERFFFPLISIFQVIWDYYCHLPYFCFFYFIRFIFNILQQFPLTLYGINKKLNRIRYGLDYEISGQILNVHWACTIMPTDKVRAINFIASHHSLVHPKYVLESDKCILAEVTTEYALFVQLKKPLTEYSVKNVTFLYDSLYLFAGRIIIMPMTSLQRLSIEMGKPKNDGANITFLWNSGRSGSTLISKIVDKADPDTLALSEPPVLPDLYFHKRLLRPIQYERLFETSIRILIKPVSGKSKLFLKPIYTVMNLADDTYKLLPKSKMLYSYRNPLRTVLAHERAFGLIPTYRGLQCFLITNTWAWGERIFHFNRLPIIEHAIKGNGMFDLCCIVWAENTLRYFQFAKKFKFPAISYDRLHQNPHQFCSEILEFCGIDSSRVQYGLEAIYDGDSQEGSLFSQSKLKAYSTTEFTPELKARTDRFCDQLNLPRLEYPHENNKQFPSDPQHTENISDIRENDDNNSRYENSHSTFITGPDRFKYECMYAGNASGKSLNNKKAQLTLF